MASMSTPVAVAVAGGVWLAFLLALAMSVYLAHLRAVERREWQARRDVVEARHFRLWEAQCHSHPVWDQERSDG